MARRKTRGAQEQVLKAAMKAVLECDPSGATIYRIAQDLVFPKRSMKEKRIPIPTHSIKDSARERADGIESEDDGDRSTEQAVGSAEPSGGEEEGVNDKRSQAIPVTPTPHKQPKRRRQSDPDVDEATDQEGDGGHAESDAVLLDEENPDIDLNFPLDRSESRMNAKPASSPNPTKTARRGRGGTSRVSKKARTGKNK